MVSPAPTSSHAWKPPYYLGLGIVLLLLALPLFAHLDDQPVRWWDESRLAHNALEMTQNGRWLVPHFAGQPDLWNTKPPLMIWLMALSIKAFGYNELALRLPAALFSTGTCVLLYWFAARKFQKPILGILAALVLVTAPGFLKEHVARTGDYEAPLLFFTTAYCLLFFFFLEESKPHTLLWFFVALSAAALTKGVAGLLFCPGLFCYALLRKKVGSLLQNKNFYLGLALFLLLVPGYYLLREHYNPGYWQAVRSNELGGRYLTTLEEHREPADYYYNLLRTGYFNTWFILLPFSIFTGLTLIDKATRWFTVFLLVVITTFLLIISAGGTKLSWYVAPTLPFLSLLTGISVWFFITCLSQRLPDSLATTPFNRKVLSPAFALLLMAAPYQQALDTALNPPRAEHARENEQLALFLQAVQKGKIREDHFKILHPPEQNIGWYETVLRLKGKKVSFITPEALQVGDRVVVQEAGRDEYLRVHFEERLLLEREGARLYELLGPEPVSH